MSSASVTISIHIFSVLFSLLSVEHTQREGKERKGRQKCGSVSSSSPAARQPSAPELAAGERLSLTLTTLPGEVKMEIEWKKVSSFFSLLSTHCHSYCVLCWWCCSRKSRADTCHKQPRLHNLLVLIAA